MLDNITDQQILDINKELKSFWEMFENPYPSHMLEYIWNESSLTREEKIFATLLVGMRLKDAGETSQ